MSHIVYTSIWRAKFVVPSLIEVGHTINIATLVLRRAAYRDLHHTEDDKKSHPPRRFLRLGRNLVKRR